jgi:hypothetical protein
LTGATLKFAEICIKIPDGWLGFPVCFALEPICRTVEDASPAVLAQQFHPGRRQAKSRWPNKKILPRE